MKLGTKGTLKRLLAALMIAALLLTSTVLASAEKVAGAVIDEKVGTDGEYYSVEMQAKAVSGEANAEGHFGAYYKVDGDGKSKAGVGLSAEAGAQGTLLTAKEKGQVGFEDLNVHGECAAEVGKATANAGATFAYENGSVVANAKLGTEANLLDAHIEGGVNVCGVDVGVKAGAKIGIGAKAEVGYKEGVLTIELGASLGIGAEIGFSVNVKDIEKTAEKAAGYVKQAAEKTATAVKDAATSVVKTTKNVVNKTVETVKDAYNTTKKAVKKFFDLF